MCRPPRPPKLPPGRPDAAPGGSHGSSQPRSPLRPLTALVARARRPRRPRRGPPTRRRERRRLVRPTASSSPPTTSLERDEEIEVGLPSGETRRRRRSSDATRPPTSRRCACEGARLAPAAWADAPLAPGALVLGVSRPGQSPRAALGVVARAAGEYRGGRRRPRSIASSRRRSSLHAGPLGRAGAVRVGRAASGSLTAGLVRGAAMIVPARDPAARREVAPRPRRGAPRLPRHRDGARVRSRRRSRAATGEHVALLVSRVEPDSPAERAGLLLGDALAVVRRRARSRIRASSSRSSPRTASATRWR